MVADPIETVDGIGGSSACVLEARAPAEESRQWRFAASAPSLSHMRRVLRPFLLRSGLPESEVDDLVLAAGEAAANAVEHARDPSEAVFDVLADIDGPKVRIVVRDYGRWAPGDRDGHRGGHRDGHRGRGLLMMWQLAAVSLTSGPLGTVVTLRNVPGNRRDG